MAGGKGTRLRPLTCGIPKPMVPILNKPVMEYAINLLKEHEIKDVAVTMAYLPDIIKDYFSKGEKWGVSLNYFIEDIPLGTAGSVKNCGDFINEPFVVISGDALTDLDLTAAIEYHKRNNSKATLVLKKEPVPLEYGVVITDDTGRIQRFMEKPSWGEVFSNTINTGIYILEPEVMNYYKKGENFDFSKDLFPKLLQDNVPMYGYVTEDYWCDIGALGSYKDTQFDMLSDRINLVLGASQVDQGVWTDEGTLISNRATIKPPVYIGKNCIISDNVELGPYTIIGDNCVVGPSSTLKNTSLWNNVKLGNLCELRGAVVCNNVNIGSKAKIYENCVIGEGSILKDNITVKPDIKIWPEKKVEEGTVLTQNLIWGTQARKNVFGNRSIKGEINTDITPEFATKLGACYASTFKKDGAIVVSGDESKGTCLIRNALIAGIQSTGLRAINVNRSILPMTRFAIKHFDALGGIHVQGDLEQLNRIEIEFFNEKGANIPRGLEREIENILCTESVKRCNAIDIKEVIEVDNLSYFYIEEGKKMISDLSIFKEMSPTVLLTSASKKALELAQEYLTSLGCHVKAKVADNPSLESIQAKVWEGKYTLGALIKENGETLALIDNRGKVIEDEAYQVLVSLILLKKGIKLNLVAPHTFPNAIDIVGKAYNSQVVRTKANPSSIMNEMLKNEEIPGNYLQFILNYNAIWGIGIILDYLLANSLTLTALIEEIPKFFYKKKEIPCHWEDKGRIIRELMMENKENSSVTEGVRINDEKGWGIILPDNERPIFNIYTEGQTEEFAQELCDFFSNKVEVMLKNQR